MVVSIGRLYAKVEDYAQDNYYTKNEGLENSQWFGKGAVQLGLKGKVLSDDYTRASQGIDSLGNPLRQRQKSKKYNPGRDITLSAPKSASLLGLVKGDPRVIEAQNLAVINTLKYVEDNCIFTRTGKGGINRQQTDNAVIAIFHHDDNRNGDPQMHSHCVIFNQTLGGDGKWRSMCNREIYQQKMTLGQVYHHELGQSLQKLGYSLTWNRDGTFEVIGYTPEQLKAFSTRREAILTAVGSDASAKAKALACIQTRKEKIHFATQEREALREQWQQRAEKAGIQHPEPQPLSWSQTYEHSSHSKEEIVKEAICFTSERQVAFPRHKLLREVLQRSQGKYSLSELEQELDSNKSLVKTNDGRLTTIFAIKREKQILHLAGSSKNTFTPLPNIQSARNQAKKLGLNQPQSQALIHFVTNKDGIMLCQGDAGAGKTYTVKALKQTIPANLAMRGLAPSAAAAQQLEEGTDISCQTLDAYLTIPLKEVPKNELLVVDEAGMISNSQMLSLLSRAKQTNSRVLLIGDTKQLAAVQAGSPFHLLQEKAQLPIIRIDKNVRQQDLQLKEVVDLLAAGDIDLGYQKLFESNRIKQMPVDSLRLKAVVKDYLQRDEKKQAQTLILAGTNQEKQEITDLVRLGLIDRGLLGQESREIQILKSKSSQQLNLTLASSYEIGDLIKFRTGSNKFKKELYYRVDSIDSLADTLSLRDRYGTMQLLELNRYKDREVFQAESRELRPGEQMKFTRNHYRNNQKQHNGQHFTVLGFEDNGQVLIKTKNKTQKVNSDVLLHSDYCYVDTVHSSQGKTADYCIYAAGSGRSLTVGRESFYVAASRAKYELTIYTASSKALGLAVQKSRGQENALPLVSAKLPTEKSIPTSREQEFKLLLCAKYLVEQLGVTNLQNPIEKIYQSSDGTEIRRTSNFLQITHANKKLKFDRHNATLQNTFSAPQIESQIKARRAEMQQHIQFKTSKSLEWTIEK